MDTYEETTLSPCFAIAATAMNWADWPLAAATAATPPSSAAIRCSNTSYAFSSACKSYECPALTSTHYGWIADSRIDGIEGPA